PGHGQRHYRGIGGRDRGLEHARELQHFLHPEHDAVLVERTFAVADRIQIGHKVLHVLGRQFEVEHTVEMLDHLLIRIVAAVVEVRCIEIGVQQGRGLHQPARSDVVTHLVVESSPRNVTAGAAQLGLLRERLEEQRLATVLGHACLRAEPAAGRDLRIGEEVDVVDIGDEAVENLVARPRPGKLVDDDIIDELAQRGDAAVMSIGREEAGAPQARNPDRIEDAVE
ncbi:hypothetical protein chiPu_0031163, partial [Chiloscyllium punctatum]|nr:hypothetical protein [Chiloscyllium punctatum]